MAHSLHEDGHDVVIFSPKNGELNSRCVASGLNTVSFVWKKNNYYNPFFIFKTWLSFRREKLDVIVFNSFVDIRDASLVSRLAGIKKRILRVGMPIAPARKISYKLAFRYGLTHFVGISKEIYNVFRQANFLERLRTRVIPNGIDENHFSYNIEHKGKFKKEIIYGNCVRLSEQKGLFDFLDIAKIILGNMPNSKFRLAGTGEQEVELKKYADKIGLDDRFEFVGHMENVASFYQQIDVLVFTSRYEGTARTIIEAMSSGVIVFCYDASSMTEMIEDGVDGYKVPPYKKEQLANRMIKVINDETESLIDIKENARRKVEKHFSKNKNFKNWKDVILLD